MKNKIKYKDYTIVRWVAVLRDEEPVDFFDTMAEANASVYKRMDGYEFKYAVAEEINAKGDVNPAVYGDTLKEAMDKLKEILYPKKPKKLTAKELRHEYFVAKDELREIMLEEYARHGEETPVPEMWKALHNLWDKMNKLCERL